MVDGLGWATCMATILRLMRRTAPSHFPAHEAWRALLCATAAPSLWRPRAAPAAESLEGPCAVSVILSAT